MFAVSDTVRRLDNDDVGVIIRIVTGISGTTWVIVNLPDHPEGMPFFEHELELA